MSDPIFVDNLAAAQPLPEFFDIADVLQGRSYPEVVVDFFLDETAGLALNRANNKLNELALLGRQEEHDDLEKKVTELKQKLAASKYTITLRGLPNKMRTELLDDAYAKFPRKGSDIDRALGIESPDDTRDQYFSTKLLQAMTVSIKNPSGAIQVAPSFETIQQFRDFAPSAALQVINDGMSELTEGVKAGFELGVQDTDFLSPA